MTAVTPVPPIVPLRNPPPHRQSPPLTQLDRIALKFGGVPPLARAIHRAQASPHCPPADRESPVHLTTIYKWNRPRALGGGGGLIPSHKISLVMRAARLEGIHFTPEEISPYITEG